MQHFTHSSTLEIYRLLNRVWGYTEFRYPQLEIIQHMLRKDSCLAIMPTGSGKSLCYQFLSLISTQLVLVVSPLIALMEDQVKQSKLLGIAAASLHSSMDILESNLVKQRLRQKDIRLLYVSPERLQVPSFISLINDLGLSLLVVDEAHCISQWGHDFRPAYLNINSFIKKVGVSKILALTATAPSHVRADIKRQLKIRRKSVFRASLYRENLAIQFVYSVQKREYLVEQLNRNESCIIYIQHRNRAEQIAAYLSSKGHRAIAYHAGMTKADRLDNQDRWMTGAVKCIVATNAFGMGINKSDVRTVYHYKLPNSMEDYYQEIGRAGRDGEPASCITLYNHKDLAAIKKQAVNLVKLITSRHVRYKNRSALSMLGLHQRRNCRFKYVLDYFDEHLPKNCGSCDHCNDLNIPVGDSMKLDQFSLKREKSLREMMISLSKKEQGLRLEKLNYLIEEGKVKLKDAYLELIKTGGHQS